MSNLRGKSFSEAPVKCIFLYGSNNSDSVLERSKITVPERELFKNIFCYEKFRYVFTLRKEVFSEAPLKFFFLYCSNNSDSVISVNSGIPELKDHSLITTPFQEYFCCGRSVSIIKICLDPT